MARTVVLVPRRSGDPQRDAVWTWLRARLEHELAYPVVEGTHEHGSFSRAAALNTAAERAVVLGHDWELAVVVDADTYVDGRQIEAAVARASRTGRIVHAFDEFVSLTRSGTDEILEGSASRDWREFSRWSKPGAVSSCLAVTRDLWARARGFDERFRGWGFEDRAFFETCRTLAGHERIVGPAWHLWHAKSPEKDPESELFAENRKLSERYRAASGDVDAILELVNGR